MSMNKESIPKYICPIQNLIDQLARTENVMKKITEDWNSIGTKEEAKQDGGE